MRGLGGHMRGLGGSRGMEKWRNGLTIAQKPKPTNDDDDDDDNDNVNDDDDDDDDLHDCCDINNWVLFSRVRSFGHMWLKLYAWTQIKQCQKRPYIRYFTIFGRAPNIHLQQNLKVIIVLSVTMHVLGSCGWLLWSYVVE